MLGVAIADRNFIGDDLTSGRLVIPFDLVVTEETGYFLFTEGPLRGAEDRTVSRLAPR